MQTELRIVRVKVSRGLFVIDPLDDALYLFN